MTQPTVRVASKAEIRATANEIAQTLGESKWWLVMRVVETLGVTAARAFCQQALEIEANGGIKTVNGKRQRTPGGVFLTLVKQHVKETDRQALKRIFGKAKRTVASKSQPAPTPAPPPADLLTWDDALKYANALLKHEKGEAKTVEVKLIGRPKNVAKAQSCMVAMMAGTSAPKSLPKGLPTPPEQVQNFAVFISNKHWQKVSADMKANANAELLVKGHPVFNPQKGITMVLAQAVEVIERKPKPAKGTA